MSMKMKKILLTSLAILLALSLSSCGFVEYIEYMTPENEEALAETRQGYLEELEALSSEDYYLDPEKRLYRLAMLDAVNELYESDTEEELAEVFEKHVQKILEIPTEPEITLRGLLAQIEKDLSDGVYRKKEQGEISELRESYLEKLEENRRYVEIQQLLSDFKTSVSQIKTDAVYYAEELALLKKELSSLGDDVDYSQYRSVQRESLKETVFRFREELSELKTKEECKALSEQYAGVLSSIATAKSLLTEERKSWRAEWETRISAFCAKYSISAESEIASLLDEIEAQTSAEGAAKLATEWMLGFANEMELSELRMIAGEHIASLAVLAEYRAEEQGKLQEIIVTSREKLADKTDAPEMLAVIEQAKNEIEALKTNDELWSEEDAAFVAKMQTNYGSKALKQPTTLVSAQSVEELAKIIDYYVFYQLDGQSFERATFRVRLDFAHKYADYVIKDVYWYCELVRATVGLTGSFEIDSSQLVITLIPYELSSVTNTDQPVEVNRYDSKIEYSSDSEWTDRSEDFEDFRYLELAAGKEIRVWNTHQLWYAFEHGYLPCPDEGSVAEQVLERAKEILRQIIKEGMTTEEKLFAIHAWYADNVTYDHGYNDFLYVEDRVNFPDNMVATLRSYYPEGALLENLAVCCGYARSLLIMLRIEGIEAYRVMLHQYEDNRIDNLGRNGYGSHAILAIRASDGKFYYCDMVESAAGPDLMYQKYHQLLVSAKEQYPYDHSIDRIWNDLDYGEELPKELLWDHLTYDGKKVFVESESEVRALVEAYLANATPNSQINIFYQGDLGFSVSDYLNSYENLEYHTCLYGGLNEYMIHYVGK